MLQRRGFVSCAICATAGLAAYSVKAGAQAQPAFTRTILQRTEYPGDKYAIVLATVDIEPNGIVGWHTHPGVESSYIASGSSSLLLKGQADRLLKSGDGFQIPPEVPHSVRNGPEKSRVIVNFVVEKDKPLASPVPE